jgi:hydrogenase expression/formation protein HypD
MLADLKSQFRDRTHVQSLLRELRKTITQPWVIMEICGGQTHAIMQYGLDELLPEEIEIVHGPGCPVCVTPLELVDKAIAIASQPGVIFTSFGDMLRVPGSDRDLFSVRAAGGDVRVVLSPLDAVRIARENPDRQVVFFAIGFETTAPNNTISVLKAKELDLANYSMLVSQVRVPPAMHSILSAPKNRVRAFLAAGHVCAVMGYREYEPIAAQYHVPIVITGFEPLDLVQGILDAVRQLEFKKYQVENAYARVVTREGNIVSQRIIDQVYEPCDMTWRGIGKIPMSGWKLRESFGQYDVNHRFKLESLHTHESEICIAGQILQGLKKPTDCPAFARECSPMNPLGATMVSSEGTCAAYYRYARNRSNSNAK